MPPPPPPMCPGERERQTLFQSTETPFGSHETPPKQHGNPNRCVGRVLPRHVYLIPELPVLSPCETSIHFLRSMSLKHRRFTRATPRGRCKVEGNPTAAGWLGNTALLESPTSHCACTAHRTLRRRGHPRPNADPGSKELNGGGRAGG